MNYSDYNNTNQVTVKMVEPNNPALTKLKINNTAAYNYTYRIHANTFSKNTYLLLPIHVCGFENVTLVDSTQKLIVLPYAQGDPRRMTDSQRYFTITQSTFAPYF